MDDYDIWKLPKQNYNRLLKKSINAP
jgi:hypothetical protein